MSNKTKLLTHSQSHKKVIINLEVAARVLDEWVLKRLNEVLVELWDVEEGRKKNERI
jgi:hypothetical protein